MSLEDIQKRLDAARGDGDVDADDTNDEIEDDLDDLDDDNDAADFEDGDSGKEGKEDKDDQKEDTTRKGTMSKIADILKGTFGKKKDAEPNTDDDDSNETDQKDAESVDGADDSDHDDDTDKDGKQKFIDPKFVDVARRYGWTDEHIVAYAQENTAKDVIQLGAAMEDAVGQGEATDADDGDVDLISDEVLAKLGEEEENQPILDQVVKPLLAQVKELKKSLNGIQNNQQGMDNKEQNRELKRDYDRANSLFDSHAKDFSILGETKKLKHMSDGTLDVRDSAVKVRGEVFTKAMVMRKSDPSMSMDEAMEDAMYWFRGKYGADQMEKNVLKKIKGQSQKVSPKQRSQHKTRKYATDRDRKASVVQDVLDRGRSKRK